MSDGQSRRSFTLFLVNPAPDAEARNQVVEQLLMARLLLSLWPKQHEPPDKDEENHHSEVAR